MTRSEPKCNICGSTKFSFGPGNRLSRSALEPLCTNCRSLERTRISHKILCQVAKKTDLKNSKLLICGEDTGLEKSWFASSFSLPRSDLELRLLTMPSTSFDFILCVNVLQDVTDMELVLSNLGQRLSPTGMIFVMYQNPVLRSKTEEWGSPQPQRGGARRAIGRDFEARYAKIFPELLAFQVSTTDPVTQDEDIAYLITKNPIWLEQAFNLSLDVRLMD